MNHDTIRGYVSSGIKFLFSLLVVILLVSVVWTEMTKKPPAESAEIQKEQEKMRRIMAKGGRLNDNLPDPWPARMNRPYPDIALFDQGGQSFSLSGLKGRVIVLEFIDVTAPVSLAQSGVQDADQYAQPFADILSKNTSPALALPHKDIVELKIIIYGAGGGQATRDDAQEWAMRFGLERSKNVIVAVPAKDMRDETTQSLIGGFQLLDKNMILRVDSAGKTPKHNLRLTLAPLVPKLVR